MAQQVGRVLGTVGPTSATQPDALPSLAQSLPSNAELLACWDRFELVLERRLVRRGFPRQIARDAGEKVRKRALKNISNGWAASVSGAVRRCWANNCAKQCAITLTQRQRPTAALGDRADGSFDRFNEGETTAALCALVRDALGRLTSNRRRAVEMYNFEGMTLREIADTLAIAVPSAQDRIRAALNALAPVLAEVLYQPEFEDIRGRFPGLTSYHNFAGPNP